MTILLKLYQDTITFNQDITDRKKFSQYCLADAFDSEFSNLFIFNRENIAKVCKKIFIFVISDIVFS